MTQPQALSIALIVAVAILLAWRRLPAEIVALGGLIAGVLAGSVPAATAFAGFGSEMEVTAAAAMLVSTAIARSGAVETLVRPLLRRVEGDRAQATALAAIIAAFSATSRSGGLGTLLPFAAQVAARRRSSSATLLLPMALAATIGGGLTLIGSVPNIVVAEFGARGGGTAFGLFAFTPVGLGVTAAALILLWSGYGWLPARPAAVGLDATLHARGLTAEARVPADSPFAGRTVATLEMAVGRGAARVAMILRERFRRIEPTPERLLAPDDILLLSGEPDDLERLISAGGLVLADGGIDDPVTGAGDTDDAVREGVVTTGSPLVGATPDSNQIRVRHRLRVLAVGRRDAAVTRRLRFVRIEVGDVLILKGPREHLADAMEALRILPLSERPVALGARRRSWVPIAVLVAAAALVALGRMPVSIAFVGAAVAVLLLRAMTTDEAYRTLDWSTLIVLGATIPLAAAVRDTGASAVVAGGIAPVAAMLPPLAVVAALIAAGIVLASYANGIVAALLLAPIAVSLFERLSLRPEAGLMAVAVGTTAAVLGPLAGEAAVLPGARRSPVPGDARLGVALAVAVAAAGAPLIAVVWGLARA